MKAQIAHIQSGVSKWYLKDIAPLGWKAMLMSPLVNMAVANTLNKHAGTVALLADESGYIDIDALHKEYSEIISKAGTVELFGIRFNTQDLDALCETIKAEIPAK